MGEVESDLRATTAFACIGRTTIRNPHVARMYFFEGRSI